MRILFVLHTFPPESWGGTELHVLGLARTLSQEHDVRIFCRGGDSRRADGDIIQDFQDGLLVTRFNNLYSRYDDFTWIHRNPAAHAAFVDELESFRPDVVHFHHLTNLSTTLPAAAKARDLPVVMTLHDFWMVCLRGQRLHPDMTICETIEEQRCHECLSSIWPQWFLPREPGDETPSPLQAFRESTREAASLADIVITPSAFHRERMLEDMDLDPERIEAIPHGLDHSMFHSVHDAHRPVKTIGYVGSVVPPKGVHILLEAFNLLRDDSLELRIHGSAPVFHDKKDYLGELRKMAENAAGTVRFMGHYDNARVPVLLEDIDILVVPSLWWETFSLTIREAMLAGIPVVASNLGAMREALADSQAGLLFEAGRPRDLARKLKRLIDDERLRLRLSNRRLEVKTLERNAQDYLDVYARAARISETRKGTIVVKEPFSQKRVAQGDAGDNDIGLTIEKVGSGDVRVESSVERGERTRVSLSFNYAPDADGTQIHVVLDFKKSDGEVKPVETAPAVDVVADDVVPDSAEDGTADMMKAQSPDHETRRVESAMYELDENVPPKHVRKLDEMVEQTHLAPEDRNVRPRRRRERDRKAEPRREKSRRDTKPAEKSAPKPPRKAATPKPAAKPRPPKTEAEDVGEVVWTKPKSWGLPEKSGPPPRQPDRAPNYRIGKQPSVISKRKPSGFGEGLDSVDD